jgi:hypothetical protein
LGGGRGMDGTLFSGEGFVHRLKASLSLEDIRKALKSWNIKDRLVEKIQAHIRKRAQPPPPSPDSPPDSPPTAASAATGTVTGTVTAAASTTPTAVAAAAIIATAEGQPYGQPATALPRGQWKQVLHQASAMDWRVLLEVVLTSAKAVSDNTAIRKVVEASLNK